MSYFEVSIPVYVRVKEDDRPLFSRSRCSYRSLLRLPVYVHGRLERARRANSDWPREMQDEEDTEDYLLGMQSRAIRMSVARARRRQSRCFSEGMSQCTDSVRFNRREGGGGVRSGRGKKRIGNSCSLYSSNVGREWCRLRW